jgi:hypothetical protein
MTTQTTATAAVLADEAAVVASTQEKAQSEHTTTCPRCSSTNFRDGYVTQYLTGHGDYDQDYTPGECLDCGLPENDTSWSTEWEAA